MVNLSSHSGDGDPIIPPLTQEVSVDEAVENETSRNFHKPDGRMSEPSFIELIEYFLETREKLGFILDKLGV